jgi:hypothetical protein
MDAFHKIERAKARKVLSKKDVGTVGDVSVLPYRRAELQAEPAGAGHLRHGRGDPQG